MKRCLPCNLFRLRRVAFLAPGKGETLVSCAETLVELCTWLCSVVKLWRESKAPMGSVRHRLSSGHCYRMHVLSVHIRRCKLYGLFCGSIAVAEIASWDLMSQF
jgi:hypothetical protein